MGIDDPIAAAQFDIACLVHGRRAERAAAEETAPPGGGDSLQAYLRQKRQEMGWQQ